MDNLVGMRRSCSRMSPIAEVKRNRALRNFSRELRMKELVAWKPLRNAADADRPTGLLI